MSEAAAAWTELFGRLHPVVLHLPIGLLAGLAAMEVAAMVRRAPIPREFTRILVILTAAAAVLAAGTGYVLGRESADASVTFIRHQQLGIALAAACVLTAVIHLAWANVRAYRLALVVTLAILLPVGHLGGSMTHGDAFLTAPVARVLRATASAIDPGGTASPEILYALAETPPAPRPSTALSPAAAPSPGTPVEISRDSVKDPQTPIQSAAMVPARDSSAAEVITSHIESILAAACTDCHGHSRQRGGLALHNLAAISAGGKSGPVLVAGSPEQSEIVRRLRLPRDHKQHMPPAGKPQLSEDQIRAIEAWIAADSPAEAAPAGAASPALAAAAEVDQPLVVQPVADDASAAMVEQMSPPDPVALKALSEHLVHFEGAASGSHLLSINFAASARNTDDSVACRLLEPLLANLDTLALSQSNIGDKTAASLAGASHLRRLDLRGTAVSDAAVAAVRDLPNLEELVLARTRLSDAAVEHLAAMPALQRVFVWNAGITGDGVADLRSRRPDLYVDAGESPEALAQEVEAEIKLTSDAPLPGEEPKPPPPEPVVAALDPINNVCPVSGGPVDPRFAVVHKNRVIGFCCPNCPGQFWADPDKFEAKLDSELPITVAGD